LIERSTGTHILRALPHGHDVAVDLPRRLPGFTCNVVFDVGANRGQSVPKLRKAFPGASIHCFEPIGSAFEQLVQVARDDAGVRCHKLGFSAERRDASMVKQGDTTTHFVIEPGAAPPEGAVIETIALRTLDDFCAEQSIGSIDFLKIDTEGSDLDVLRGGARMLREQRVAVVEVEAGMNPGNTRHVPFEGLKAHLEQADYLLFGIYEQVWEWPTGAPNLRRTNCVYLSRTVVERYTRRDR
jgi:FkbM family methyltransferase